MTRGFTGAAIPARARRRVDGMLMRPNARVMRAVPVLGPVLVGLVALAVWPTWR